MSSRILFIFRPASILLAVCMMLIVIGFVSMGINVYTGTIQPNETGYDVSISDGGGEAVIENGEMVDRKYDIKKEELSPKSRDIFNVVESETGTFGEKEAVRFEDNSDIELTDELLDEPVICDDCSVHSDTTEREDSNISTGTIIVDGYYTVETDRYTEEQSINYGNIVFWSILSLFNILIMVLILRK